MFFGCDSGDTNKISFRNLARVAEELGENIDEEELQDMINQADCDGDGETNIGELQGMINQADCDGETNIGEFR